MGTVGSVAEDRMEHGKCRRTPDEGAVRVAVKGREMKKQEIGHVKVSGFARDIMNSASSD